MERIGVEWLRVEGMEGWSDSGIEGCKDMGSLQGYGSSILKKIHLILLSTHTAPGIPRRSPIQVLTRPNPA